MKKYRVGFGRIDVTPLEVVPLAGFGNTSHRLNKAVRDPLYASCIAITDGEENTLLLISLDLMYIREEDVQQIRNRIQERLGIPGTQVMICCTFTHAAPDVMNREEGSIARYQEMLNTRVVLAAELAVSDRMEADVYIGDVETESLNFTRHYWGIDKKTGETVPVGENYNQRFVKRITGHASEIDHTFHMVKFAREGLKDLVLANYRAHGIMCSNHNEYDVSADWMGDFRGEFERKNEADLVYFQGACGNVSPYSLIRSEEIARESEVYARFLTSAVMPGLRKMTPVEPALLKTRQKVFLADPIPREPEKEEAAEKVYQYWTESHDWIRSFYFGEPLGINNPFTADALLQRKELPEKLPIEMDVITLGELAFIAAPGGLFDTFSVELEDNAPYQKLITLGFANGYQGYLPNREAFDFPCIEAECALTAKGTGEEMTELYLQMLKEMKEN